MSISIDDGFHLDSYEMSVLRALLWKRTREGLSEDSIQNNLSRDSLQSIIDLSMWREEVHIHIINYSLEQLQKKGFVQSRVSKWGNNARIFNRVDKFFFPKSARSFCGENTIEYPLLLGFHGGRFD